MSEPISRPPSRTKRRQVGEAVGEAAASVIPVAGGPIAVLWVTLVGAAFEKRRQAWADEITDAVNDLLDRVDSLEAEDLAQNPEFMDAVAFATATAVTTSHRVKLDALRSAVLNTASGIELDADTQAIFLRHVRDLTPSHLKLLTLLNDPPRWFEAYQLSWPNVHMGGLGKSIVEKGIPEFAGRRSFYDQLDRDLNAAGLANTGGLHTTMTGDGLSAIRTTETGGLIHKC